MIDSMWMLGVVGFMLAATFGALIAVLVWIGGRMYQKIEEIAKTMHQIAANLHEKINDHGERISALEAAKCRRKDD